MDFEVLEPTTAGDLLDTVYSKTPALRDWDKSILIASGLQFVGRDYLVKNGDQISIMPPVQGG